MGIVLDFPLHTHPDDPARTSGQQGIVTPITKRKLIDILTRHCPPNDYRTGDRVRAHSDGRIGTVVEVQRYSNGAPLRLAVLIEGTIRCGLTCNFELLPSNGENRP